MLGPIASFSRETGRLYLRYMAVGAAALPAGLLCAWLSSRGAATPWVVLVLLGAASFSGFSLWRWFDRPTRLTTQLAYSHLAMIPETSFLRGIPSASGSALGGFGAYRVDVRSVWVREISSGIVIQVEGRSEQFADQASGMELPVHASA
jgi:hypothetical protein